MHYGNGTRMFITVLLVITRKTRFPRLAQWLKKKNLPANVGDTGDVCSTFGWKDTLEKEKTAHSSILAWLKSHGRRSLVGYTPWGCKELGTTEHTTLRKPASPQISRNNKVDQYNVV